MAGDAPTETSMQNQLDEGLVFDVGAHLGEDSDFYLNLGYRVVAIEANPELVQRLVERFHREIQEGRYVVVPYAIGDANEEVTFYVNEALSIWGTTDPKWATRNQGKGSASKKIRVPSIRFEEVLNRHGHPLFMKVDIEGADMLCLRALEHLETAARPKFVSIESTKTSWRDLLGEFDALERLGYTHYQVVNQRKHPRGTFRTVTNGVIDYEFGGDASGPFGADLAGPWLTRRQALKKYIPIFLLYKTIGDSTFLRKILRKVPKLRKVPGWVSWYDTHAMRA
jgi:FkbM family methyltransferase